MTKPSFTLDDVASLLDKKLNEKFSSFKCELVDEILNKVKKEVKSELREEFDNRFNAQAAKINELQSTVEILRSHVDNLKEKNVATKQEDLEQYGRRVTLRVYGVEPVPNEKAEGQRLLGEMWPIVAGCCVGPGT